MAHNSAIEWTHHTFNPWWGCTKVSVGPKGACEHCYAERDAKRYAPGQELWAGNRRTFGEHHWNEPRRWDRACAKAGIRERVFCASMADVFDNKAPEGARAQLFKLIHETPNLDWLLLTKRPGNINRMIDEARTEAGLIQGVGKPWPWPNVWVGCSVVTQEEAERDVPKLLQVPAVVRFLSCEPLMEAIDFAKVFERTSYSAVCCYEPHCEWCDGTGTRTEGPRPDWIIAGGESGGLARAMNPAWPLGILEFCQEFEVPFFFKQWGEWAPNCLCEKPRPCGTTERPRPGSRGVMFRCGKKAAGRELAGAVHSEIPTPRTVR